MYGVLKRSVDKWDSHTAISSGYQSVYDANLDTNTILNLLQDKNTLYPTTNPPITCFGHGRVRYTATERLYADKVDYEWNHVYKNKVFDWRTHICEATTVVYENTCSEVNTIPLDE